MKEWITFLLQLLFKPIKAFKLHPKDKMRKYIMSIFFLSYLMDFLVKHISGIDIHKLASLFYLDMLFLAIFIYIFTRIFIGKGDIYNTAISLLAANAPLIAMGPFILLGSLIDNVYITLISKILLVLWKLFLLVVGVSILHSVKVVKSVVIVLVSLILTIPIMFNLRKIIENRFSSRQTANVVRY